MNRLSIETCADALNIAAINRKSAFQTELAVGLGVFLISGGTNLDAKRLLREAYAASGYQCLHGGELDYKTVNRRINATAELFHKVPVKTWAGKLSEKDMLRAICIGLEPHELHSVADVMRKCNPAKKAATPVAVKPHGALLTGPIGTNDTGQQKVVAMFRRAADQVEHGAQHFETKHLALMIPQSATREELIQMAHKLLSLAEDKKAKDLLTA